MNKQKLLEQMQVVNEHLAEAVEGQYEIAHLVIAVGQLADVVEQVIPALEETNARISRNFDYTQELVDRVVERLED